MIYTKTLIKNNPDIIYCIKNKVDNLAFLQACEKEGIKWTSGHEATSKIEYYDEMLGMLNENAQEKQESKDIVICYLIDENKLLSYGSYRVVVLPLRGSKEKPCTFVEFKADLSKNPELTAQDIFEYFKKHNKNLTKKQIALLARLKEIFGV